MDVCALARVSAAPPTPGWGVGVWVCLCVRSACTLRLLAGVCGVGMCAWTRVSAAPRPSWLGCWGSVCACVRAPLVPRHSWLGYAVWACVLGLGLWLGPASPCWDVGVCLFVCALRLYPATGGWGVRAWARVSAAPHHSWLGCWAVRVCVRAPLLPRHSWLGCAVWVCVHRLEFGLRLPLLAGLLGFACVCVRALLVPRHSWLGCAVWVCVLGLRFWLRPATPGSGVGVCVSLRARPACTSPILAWVCGVRVRCCLAPVLVPWFVACCARCPGLRHPVAVVAWHPSVCLGCGRRRSISGVPGAPAWCAAPRPVRSLSVLRVAFPTPWCLSPPQGLGPPLYWVAARGTWRPPENRAHCACRWPPAEAGALGSLRVVPVRGPTMGLSLAGPSGVRLELRALRLFACVDPVTDMSSFPHRPSFDGSAVTITTLLPRSRATAATRATNVRALAPSGVAALQGPTASRSSGPSPSAPHAPVTSPNRQHTADVTRTADAPAPSRAGAPRSPRQERASKQAAQRH